MKNRKWLFVLILVMLTAFIAGCTKEAEGETEKGNESTTDNSFSIALRTLATPYVESHPDLNNDKFVKEMERLSNTDIKIRLVPHNEYVERLTLMLASNDVPDVLQASGGVVGPELAGGVQANAFLPLDDLIAEHGPNLLKIIPQEAWDTVTYDGKIYAIPDYLANPSRRGTAIRMDLLEKTGLDVPQTIDEYLEVLRAFKNLGVQHPFQGREKFKYSDTFFGAFDAFPYQYELYEGQVVPKFMAGDKTKDALAFYNTLYKEGLLSQEFLTTQQPEYRSNIIAGKVGMWSMNAEEVNAWEQEIKNTVPDAELAIIPSPIGPDGKGGHYWYGSTTRSFLINAETKADPAAIIKFFDWQLTEEAERFFTYGIEDDTYTLNADGTVNYEIPTETNLLNAQHFLNRWLWLTHDATYTKGILELTEDGQKLLSVFDDVLRNEGRDGIQFSPPLGIYSSNPEISPGSDTPADIWMTGAAKIILGQEPLDHHDKIVEEWLRKGGTEAIKEATERYNNGEGIQLPRTNW